MPGYQKINFRIRHLPWQLFDLLVLQKTTCRLSIKCSKGGVANAATECSWLRNLLHELHVQINKATIIYCDNVSAVYLTQNPVHHCRTKHVELDIHFVHEKVAVGQVRFLHVPTNLQFVDIMTKGLPSALFDQFKSSLNIRLKPTHTESVNYPPLPL